MIMFFIKVDLVVTCDSYIGEKLKITLYFSGIDRNAAFAFSSKNSDACGNLDLPGGGTRRAGRLNHFCFARFAVMRRRHAAKGDFMSGSHSACGGVPSHRNTTGGNDADGRTTQRHAAQGQSAESQQTDT